MGLAGSAGAVARFVVDGLIKRRYAGRFPLGTMFINVTGSLLVGFFVGLVAFRGWSEAWTTVAGAGFCGGYTTFSTASYESVRLIHDRCYRLALTSVILPAALGVTAVAGGMALSRL